MKTRTIKPNKSAKPSAPAQKGGDVFLSHAVDEFICRLPADVQELARALRKTVLGASPSIREGIKWNVPSFHDGEWFATFHVRTKVGLQIVFHRGAKPKAVLTSPYVEDRDGLLKWLANDRAIAAFATVGDLRTKEDALDRLVKAWIQRLKTETG